MAVSLGVAGGESTALGDAKEVSSAAGPTKDADAAAPEADEAQPLRLTRAAAAAIANRTRA